MFNDTEVILRTVAGALVSKKAEKLQKDSAIEKKANKNYLSYWLYLVDSKL